MENKISLEASGMPGVIKTMEKHFGKLIKEASTVKTVPASVIVDCNHVVGAVELEVLSSFRADIPVVLTDLQRDDFKDNWPRFRDNFSAYNFCPLCGISVTSIIQDFREKREKEMPVGAPDKGREDLSGGVESRHAVDAESQSSTCGPTPETGDGARITRGSSESPAQNFPDEGRKYTEFPDFPFMIDRDDKGEIEVAIQVIDFTPAGREGNGEWLGAYVQLGPAFTLDGQSIQLTELESERAEREFLEMANS